MTSSRFMFAFFLQFTFPSLFCFCLITAYLTPPDTCSPGRPLRVPACFGKQTAAHWSSPSPHFPLPANPCPDPCQAQAPQLPALHLQMRQLENIRFPPKPLTPRYECHALSFSFRSTCRKSSICLGKKKLGQFIPLLLSPCLRVSPVLCNHHHTNN
jgi:hypothetical protein